MRFIVAIWVTLCPITLLAHHSIVGDFGLDAQDNFDPDLLLEFEGEVVTMRWANPHPRMTLKTLAGEIVNFEAAGLGIPERRGLRRDVIEEGDRVKVTALAPTRARGSRHLILNSLPSEGPELLMLGSATDPRWPEESNGSVVVSFRDVTIDESAESDTQQQATGIFRVWERSALHPFWGRDLPVTDEARASRAAFDLDSDYPLMRCEAPGMPRAVINNAWPIEFRERDGNIEMRMEEFDVVRIIHVDTETEDNDPVPTPLGHSVGRWEERSLIVETTRVNWPFFDDSGLPLSESVEILEEFTLSADGSDLDYLITVTDPEIFTEAVTGTTACTWTPGLTIKPYDCTLDE